MFIIMTHDKDKFCAMQQPVPVTEQQEHTANASAHTAVRWAR